MGKLKASSHWLCLPQTSGADIAEIVRRSLLSKVKEERLTGKEPSLVTTDIILGFIGNYERTKQE